MVTSGVLCFLPHSFGVLTPNARPGESVGPVSRRIRYDFISVKRRNGPNCMLATMHYLIDWVPPVGDQKNEWELGPWATDR